MSNNIKIQYIQDLRQNIQIGINDYQILHDKIDKLKKHRNYLLRQLDKCRKFCNDITLDASSARTTIRLVRRAYFKKLHFYRELMKHRQEMNLSLHDIRDKLYSLPVKFLNSEYTLTNSSTIRHIVSCVENSIKVKWGPRTMNILRKLADTKLFQLLHEIARCGDKLYASDILLNHSLSLKSSIVDNCIKNSNETSRDKVLYDRNTLKRAILIGNYMDIADSQDMKNTLNDIISTYLFEIINKIIAGIQEGKNNIARELARQECCTEECSHVKLYSVSAHYAESLAIEKLNSDLSMLNSLLFPDKKRKTRKTTAVIEKKRTKKSNE